MNKASQPIVRPAFALSGVCARILLVCLAWAWTCAGLSWAAPGPRTAEALYEQARQSYYGLLRSDEKKAQRQNWLETIGRFQTVLDRYPESYSGYKAAFTMGRLYQGLSALSGKSEDLDEAVKRFHWVVDRFPKNRLTDDALFQLGRIHRDRQDYAAATGFFTQIVEDYPKGDQMRAARKELQALSKQPAPAEPAPAPVRLYDLEYENGDQTARVTLRASGPVHYSQERLENPDRIHLVFDRAQWDAQLPNVMTLQTGILTHVEPRRTAEGKSELLVELTGAGPVSAALRNAGSQLVLELKSLPSAQQTASADAPKVPAALADKKKGQPVVILDPGHGGKDDGAHGVRGLLEKEINLQIANRVKKILTQRYGYQVALTRTDDTFIELKDRGDFANQVNADLFVSIHANAAKRRAAKGIETYYLGAGSGDRALETAARENGDLVGSVEDDEVQQILASLISTTKMNESARLAAAVQKRLAGVMTGKFTQVQDLGVKEGPFYVLHRTNMPSILIEVGFLTNRQEERRLQHATYQYWLAESIAQGIHQFLKEKGPSI